MKITKLLLLCSLALVPTLPSYGHLYGYNFQEWKNEKDNILIQFDTIPHTPTMGNSSSLIFSVQNLKTGEHIQNFKETITIASRDTGMYSNEVTHKFTSTDVKDGDFSQDYVFASGGTYDVFLRVDTADKIIVSRFTVFVSSPQFQFLNMSFLLLPIIIFIVILAGVLIVVARYVYKKK